MKFKRLSKSSAMNRKRLARVLPFFVAILIFNIISCKPDNDRGNVATIRLPTEPDKLNPLATEDMSAILVMNQMFMQLLDFDPKTLELVPILAKNRPTVVHIDTGVYKGGTAYTYEIREEATWDNSTPVTAADYVFTVKTILNKKTGASNLRSGLDFIKDIVVDVQNPKKFTILSDKTYILSESKAGTFAVLPEYIYDTEGILKNYKVADLAKMVKDTTLKLDDNLAKFANKFQNVRYLREKDGIVGCGPYAFDEWISGQGISVKKKANWWGEKLASTTPLMQALPDKIIFKPIKDATAAMSQIQNGELDASFNMPPKDFNALKNDSKVAAHYELAAIPLLSLAYVGFNCKDPKLSDKRTRRAIAHIFDVDAIVKNLAGGFGTPSGSPFVSQRPYYDANLKPIPLNIEQAKALLVEAGWKDSNGDGTVDKKIGGKTTELVLRYVFGNNEQAKNLGLMLQESGKKAGIGIKLEPVETAMMQDYFKKRNYDMFYSAWGFPPGIDDPKEIWHSTSNTPDGGNRFQFENKQLDVLIDQIRSELDETKRNVLYKQFQLLIYEEQPTVFLFIRQERIALHKRFEAAIMAMRPGFLPNTFKLKK
jgi:peptide/nickel transport system substrate-binding protein